VQALTLQIITDQPLNVGGGGGLSNFNLLTEDAENFLTEDGDDMVQEQ